MTKEQSKPNILFLIVDSLRSDKSYGNERTCITPNLDSIIKKGTFFNQAISPSDATRLSIKSIFTSQIPSKINDIESITDSIQSPKIPTLVSVLKKSGYKIFGTLPELEALKSIYYEFNDNDKFSIKNNWPRLDDGIGQEVIKKIRTVLNEPWFYFLHILDVHSKITPQMPPLVIPEKFDSKEFGISRYERAISNVDYWIGKILKEIDLEKTIVIITSDHGSFIPYYQKGKTEISLEETKVHKVLQTSKKIKTPSILKPVGMKLYNRIKNNSQDQILAKIKNLSLSNYEKRNLLGMFSDSKTSFRIMYDEIVRVPLIFLGKNIPSGKIHSQQVCTYDILPTIIDILQLDEEIRSDGHSLLPIMDQKETEEKPIFIRSSFPMNQKSGYLLGIRTSKYKYMRSSDDPKKHVFLFDLEKDPKEEKNIATEKLDTVNEYEDFLKNYFFQTKNEEEFDKSQTKIIEDELKRLGYINWYF